MNSFSFLKKERLLNRKDFVNLNRLGKRYHTAHFNIIFRENGLGITRLGITASKKIGNSVKRNGIKRFIREYFRLNRRFLPGRLDINIIARQSSGRKGAAAIRDDLKDCFETIAGKTRMTGR